MNIPLLYNYDPTRTLLHADPIVVDATGIQYLTHIPKKNTLVIPGFTVVTTTPLMNEVRVNWGDEYEYENATGKLVFNVGNVGATSVATYVPIASRVDANVINKLIDFVNPLNGNVYTKADLVTIGEAIVEWKNLQNIPGVATPLSSGFMSATDKISVNRLVDTENPIGAILVSGSELAPTSWGGDVEMAESASVKPRITGGKLYFDVNIGAVNSTSIGEQSALKGTYGTPGASNKYVTETDPILLGSRPPTSHQHEIADIELLSAELFDKSPLGHRHLASEIDGLTLLQGKQGDIGPQGIVGPQGIQGIVGPRGLQGLKGDMGIGPADLLYDFFAYGLLTNVPTPKSFTATKDPGSVYVRGVHIVKGDTDIDMTQNYVGPYAHGIGATPTSKYPVFSGNFAGSTSDTYEISITKSETVAGDGTFEYSVSKNGSVISTYPGLAGVFADGLSITFHSTNGITYVIGDAWGVTILETADVYEDVNTEGYIVRYWVPVGSAAPVVDSTSIRIQKLTTDGTGITSIDDLRKLDRVILESKTITQSQGDSSAMVATTKYADTAVSTLSTTIESTSIKVITNTMSINAGDSGAIALPVETDMNKVMTFAYNVTSSINYSMHASMDDSAKKVYVTNAESTQQNIRLVVYYV